jgi:hypothetical protein
MPTTHSTDTTGFWARTGQNLTHLKWSVDRATADLQAARVLPGAGLRARSDQAHAALEVRRQEIDVARAWMQVLLEAKKAETEAALATHGTSRHLERLVRKAGRAEDYASVALLVAWGAIEEAHAAILEAAAARADADERGKRDELDAYGPVSSALSAYGRRTSPTVRRGVGRTSAP